ncbi:hypothetical protein PISMIDRAFT_493802 [Pisolithus microcarpus 441]|uniref:DUF6533 domain-containing protein n=1 Tax=Pisolithus microcarpus 441 TaxID=765257 RepID=A0A0C9Z9Q8_9AGAM|nr:hypothetical protein PISMIDRAFT_493802 [Pisolithus microcarpus 441]
MSTTTEEELQALYQYLNQARVVNNVTIACAAFLVYDILINLDKEIPLIWRYYHHADDEFMPWRHRARRTLIQALFIFGRYYAPLFLVIFFVVYTHEGLSVSLYAFTWSSTAAANHFSPKVARLTSTTSFLGEEE